MTRLILFCELLLAGSAFAAVDGTWSYIDVPTATATDVYDVDGARMVGTFSTDPRYPRGFVYDGTTWTVVMRPNSISTSVMGIDGDNLVGVYTENSAKYYGFIHNFVTKSWTYLNASGASSTFPIALCGDNAVGYYWQASNSVYRGFVYNRPANTWSVIDAPGAGQTANLGTFPRSIEGNKVVGFYSSASNIFHGFIYDLSTQVWTTLDFPGAASTNIYGISGSRLVGTYQTSSAIASFLYDGSTWTVLEPGPGTRLYGIDGEKVVGEQGNHGLLLTPKCSEPIKADVNGDCKVNIQDFAELASHWLEDYSQTQGGS